MKFTLLAFLILFVAHLSSSPIPLAQGNLRDEQRRIARDLERQKDFLFSNSSLFLQSKLKIVLLGWDKQTVSAVQLKEKMAEYFPVKYYYDKKTGNQIGNVGTQIEYSVEYYPYDFENFLVPYFQKAKKSLVESASHSEPIQRFSLQIDEAFLDFFDQIGKDTRHLFFLKPNKEKLKNLVNNGKDFEYAYKYLESDTEIKNFIGRRRYAVYDLSAGPVIYGHFETPELPARGFPVEIVSQDAFIDFADLHNTPSAIETGYLIHIISTSISYVFFPDLEFNLKSFVSQEEQTERTEEILIPILIFRNDNQADVSQHINLENIRASLAPLSDFLGLKITLVTGNHALHDHKHLAMAFEKSQANEMAFSRNTFDPKPRRFVNSKKLLYEIERQDVLTSSLLTLAQEKKSKRILPVYVFAISDSELLMENYAQTAVTPNEVVVLQGDQRTTPIPYFSQQFEPILLDLHSINRAIIAGISSAMGMSDPSVRVSPLKNSLEYSYLWALGHHPFGPFSKFSGAGTLLSDHCLKNLLISHINAGIETSQKAIQKVDLFASNYLYNPFSDSDLSHQKRLPWNHWIDQLYRKPDSSMLSRSAIDTVYQIHRQIERLNLKFGSLAKTLDQQTPKAAIDFVRELEALAVEVLEIAETSTKKAELELTCCGIQKTPKDPATSFFNLFLVFVLGGVVVLICFVLVFKR